MTEQQKEIWEGVIYKVHISSNTSMLNQNLFLCLPVKAKLNNKANSKGGKLHKQASLTA